MRTMKVLLLFVATLLLTLQQVKGDSEDQNFLFENQSCAPPIRCPYVPKDQVYPQSQECCHNLTEGFQCAWFFNGVYLTRFLQTLKSWNCTEELQHQCENRYASFTTFTENIYLSFCDHTKLERKCLPKMTSLIDQDHTEKWNAAILKLDTDNLDKEEMLDACVQTAIYENDPGDNYVEITEVSHLYCDVAWAGFDGPSMVRRKISSWDIFPPRCKVQIQVMTAILILLGILGFVTNSAFIATVYATPSLRHSQYVYKTSIAVSDIIMSLLVFPSIVNIIYKHANEPYKLSEVSLLWNSSANITNYIDKGAADIIAQSYLDGFGAIYTLAFMVSVYTLLAATAERLYAVTFPLRYRKSSSWKNAMKISLTVWCVSFVVAILPIFPISKSLRYVLESRAYVLMGEELGSVMMATLSALPVLLMWVMVVLTFIQIKRSAKRSNQMKGGKTRKQNKQEVHLAVTLFLMVATFTLSILPAAVLLVIFRKSTFSFMLLTNFADSTSYLSTSLMIGWVAFILFNCNTMWYFYIYNVRNKQFRSALVKCLGDLLLRIECTALHGLLQRFLSNTSTNVGKTTKKTSNSLMGRSERESAQTRV